MKNQFSQEDGRAAYYRSALQHISDILKRSRLDKMTLELTEISNILDTVLSNKDATDPSVNMLEAYQAMHEAIHDAKNGLDCYRDFATQFGDGRLNTLTEFMAIWFKKFEDYYDRTCGSEE